MSNETIQVVNLNDEACDVRVDRSGPWGNPFELKPGASPLEREICVLQYAMHLARRKDLMRRLGELRGKRLGCWCAPRTCHGALLSSLAQSPSPMKTLSLEIEARVRRLFSSYRVRTNPETVRLHVFGAETANQEVARALLEHPARWAMLEYEEQSPMASMLSAQCVLHEVQVRVVHHGPTKSEAFVAFWADASEVMKKIREMFRQEEWLIWRSGATFAGVHVSLLHDLIPCSNPVTGATHG